MFHKVQSCRVCGNKQLVNVLNLGNQYLSGIFPKTLEESVHTGPLNLIKCDESSGGCGHVQLEHTFNLNEMYGDHYGYRSGLNSSMVNHLKSKYETIVNYINLKDNDIVVDIAGNDGTFLGFFSNKLKLVSIDPTSKKFSKYFSDHVNYIPEFFSRKTFVDFFGDVKAKLVTSFSMFYDLENPCDFASQVNSILDPNEGIWVLEQSYMPEMIRQNSFDTICHEHLSYYGMRQLKYIMTKANLKIIEFHFNNINGGSISMTVANQNSKYDECTQELDELISEELNLKLDTLEPWKKFQISIDKCKNDFWNIINQCKQDNLRISALGASTKGNVILQTWGITSDVIEVIGDVNLDKNGSFTPGTKIPIKPEDDVLNNYDVFVILPWHFREFFVNHRKFKGKKLLFPLPTAEIITV